MTGLQKISESIYVGLCQKVGTRQQVRMRRDITDIFEVINNIRRPYNAIRTMDSGSEREGFRLKGSDTDTMFWPNHHKVIYDFSQLQKYNDSPNTVFIFMESEYSPPGFTLLRLLHTSNYTYHASVLVCKSCVTMNNELYISSTSYREQTCSLTIPNSSVHGPCGSGFIGGIFEYDTAHCFKCDFWPPCALSMIKRCKTWPPPLVLQDIFMSGCHLVAKGSPVSHYEDKEWRISFSQAEQKLVYAMNHCQFLVYGLLKIFLKEVINQGVVEKLLCSYFIKTVIFWKIEENKIPFWCPQNIIVCFWSCFKHIIHWVNRGECPNFFIPQNNMFSGKIVGFSQQNLFHQLFGLYKQGYTCLLLSPSIRSHIVQVLYNPIIAINVNEEDLMSVVDFDIESYSEVYEHQVTNSKNLHNCMKYLSIVEHFIAQTPLTQYHLIFLQKYTSTILQSIAFHIHNRCRDKVSNKMMYIADRISCHMLKLAAKFGFISDMLYIAMYYYRTCRYTEALSVIDKTKVKLSQPYVMYESRVNKERYTEAVRGQSWSTKIRKVAVQDIILSHDICYINELSVEQQTSQTNRWPLLCIPTHIMLIMLSVLCYNHVDTIRRQQVLDDLYVLLHHDDGTCISVFEKEISYQILGLCQEICGDKLGSLHSYQESLKQYPLQKIQEATHIRIHNLLEQLQTRTN